MVDENEAGGRRSHGGPPGGSGAADSPPTPKRLNAVDLFAGTRELILVYKNAEYRLRLTSNDKLILTK